MDSDNDHAVAAKPTLAYYNRKLSVREIRAEKILLAAQSLFAKQGFRRVTMERIAEAAGMAKTTLYAYFSDKDVVFKAVAELTARRMEQDYLHALTKQELLVDKVSAALIAKHRVTFELVRSSEHAAELFAIKNRLIGALFSDMDETLIRHTADVIEQTLAIEDALKIARVVFHASLGIANGIGDMKEVEEGITMLVRGFLEC